MQVSVETGEGLERKLTVQVPAEKMDTEIESRLKSMQGRVKVDGFRPGKVPLKVVRQRYGGQVFQEVAGEMLQTSFREAIMQENLRPAGEPRISASSMQPGAPLEYTATFEIYPEVELNPVTDLKLEAKKAEISDADVNTMLETLRKQRVSWKEAERASADGDRITIDFAGSINGEVFDGGSAQDVPVVIGSGAMIPGFEEHLTGLSKGDDTSFKVSFPEDYQATELAGKEAEFAITVKNVEAPELPEIDAEFAKAFGVEDGDLDKLKQDIKTNMEREMANRTSAMLKSQVMDKLLEANPIEVPQSTVMEEAESLRKQNAAQQQGNDLPVEVFVDDATRRVKLGMLLAELVKQSAIQVSQDKVMERVESMAKEYEDPREFVRYYKDNQQLLRGIETLVMEDMVVDWVAEQANVTSVETTFDEVMKPSLA